jgi:hypothetical protein
VTAFTVGSLVRARGREWVVLPESDFAAELLVLHPLGGTDDEVAGVFLPLERVEPAEFAWPDPQRDMGSANTAGLLRDAARLGFRAGAGPFRSLGRIAVEPRPYQLVPLLMALRQDPVRLLIADDVGIGKTIEAALIARELLDRGEIARVAVIAPPHLAEQWQRALAEQFNIDAVLVLAGTAAKLERGLGPGESLFERYQHVVVSMDWIKADRRRAEFLRVCPDFIIVDEAHTCAAAGLGRAAQLRHDLLRAIAADKTRHIVLVTATPHSGKSEDFRSLLALLDTELLTLPDDLSGEANRRQREFLARYLVQRRRGDLTDWLGENTPFPKRDVAEEAYPLTPEYRRFLDRVLDWCREQVTTASPGPSQPSLFGNATAATLPILTTRQQRVRWWSALALLRSISSSPKAAAATLIARSAPADTETADEADKVGRRVVLDLDDEAEAPDTVPGSEADSATEPDRARLRAFAKEAEALAGSKDSKLKRATEIVTQLVAEGWSPVVFCRFIPTVEYVVEHLRKHAGLKGVIVAGVTGALAPEERDDRIVALSEVTRKVLVCTDCLSEGINLQHGFDSVLHYDLSWNPTRHEQREGRVDRFGQPKARVRTLTLFGQDNPVDGIVLDVLLRKHKAIHRQLGVVVPVPMDTNSVVEAVFEGLMLRDKATASRDQLRFDFAEPQRRDVEIQWDAAVEREKKSRSLFAQAGIRVDEVVPELAASRAALGDAASVERFTYAALLASGVAVERSTVLTVDLSRAPAALCDAIDTRGDREGKLRLAFSMPVPIGVKYVTRTHPIVAGLCAYLLETALDTALEGPARRCGVVRTTTVTRRTTLVLARLRHHMTQRDAQGAEHTQLAEEAELVAFTGTPDAPEWLPDEAVEALLAAMPAANVPDDQKRHYLERILDRSEALAASLAEHASRRAGVLLESHRRVRRVVAGGIRALRVEPHLPVDVLGLYVFLPHVSDGPHVSGGPA